MGLPWAAAMCHTLSAVYTNGFCTTWHGGVETDEAGSEQSFELQQVTTHHSISTAQPATLAIAPPQFLFSVLPGRMNSSLVWMEDTMNHAMLSQQSERRLFSFDAIELTCAHDFAATPKLLDLLLPSSQQLRIDSCHHAENCRLIAGTSLKSSSDFQCEGVAINRAGVHLSRYIELSLLESIELSSFVSRYRIELI